jgi:transcriptional regulator with XRE-family HTH domain
MVGFTDAFIIAAQWFVNLRREGVGMVLFSKDAPSVNVGNRLHELREAHHISMRGLAAKSGLSANALSMIERGKTSPSVSTLYKLAEALGVDITAFFGESEERYQIVFLKAQERARVPFQRGLWENLGGEKFAGKVLPFVLTLENGGVSGNHAISHSGHEFVFCLRGTLDYQVGNQTYQLEPGDSLIFAAKLRHRWRNQGGSVVSALIVLSDFSEAERGTMHMLQDAED